MTQINPNRKFPSLISSKGKNSSYNPPCTEENPKMEILDRNLTTNLRIPSLSNVPLHSIVYSYQPLLRSDSPNLIICLRNSTTAYIYNQSSSTHLWFYFGCKNIYLCCRLTFATTFSEASEKSIIKVAKPNFKRQFTDTPNYVEKSPNCYETQETW